MNPIPKRIATLILLGIGAAGGASSARADGGFAAVGTTVGLLEEMARSARSEALGGADLALADGPAANLLNVAPLPAGSGVGFEYGTFDYATLADLTFHFDTGAISFERDAWRLGAVWMHCVTDERVVGTAYNPVGDGSTARYLDQYFLLGLSHDLARSIFARRPDLSWTVGAAWRRHSFGTTEDPVHGWDLDAGSSLGWSRSLPGGRLGITGSALWRNPTKATIETSDPLVDGVTEARLPRFRNLGLAVCAGFDLAGWPGDELTMRAMTAWRNDLLDDDDSFLGEHLAGFEVEFLEILCLRAGIDRGRIQQEDLSYGFGVTVPERWLHGFSLGYDFAKLNDDVPDDPDFLWIDGERETHSFRLARAF